MSTELPDAPPPAEAPEAPRRAPRGHPLIAWAAIAAAAAGLLAPRFFRTPPEVKETDAFEIQARAVVGWANVAPVAPALYKQLQEFNEGPAGRRLRFVVLAGELKGPAEALHKLGELRDQMAADKVPGVDAEAHDTADILDRLYRGYVSGDVLDRAAASAAALLAGPDGPLAAASALGARGEDLTAPDVTAEQRAELKKRLGWFGDLALNPKGGPDPAARAAVIAPAERLVFAEMAIVLVALGGGAVGFILLILFFALRRQMRSRFHPGSPYGGVYAETFALWMVLFVGIALGAYLLKFLPSYLPRELIGGVVELLTLLVLAWPVFRGVPWRQVRQDIGWVRGDRPLLEPFYGLLCYVAMLPVVILMGILILIVVQLGHRAGGHDLFDTPTHPIVEEVLHAGWWGWIQILFLASVVAPIVEETMFRGVLYRHMREATGPLGRGWSVILSALVVSFVFAALHPQGWLAVPLLMALAIGFTAAREWRGSLVPSMAIHALNNGVALLIAIMAAG